MRDYEPIGKDEYFQLTQFDGSESGPVSYERFVELEMAHPDLLVFRVEVSQALAERILPYIEVNELRTRGPAVSVPLPPNPNASLTVFTVRFCVHLIAEKRGGWYILERHGREPVIKDEFIEYGPKRKLGGRKK